MNSEFVGFSVASLREGGGPLAVEGVCVILNFEQMSMLRTLLQSLRASSLSEGAFLIKFVFQPQIIRNHRDKFGICGVDENSKIKYTKYSPIGSRKGSFGFMSLTEPMGFFV